MERTYLMALGLHEWRTGRFAKMPTPVMGLKQPIWSLRDFGGADVALVTIDTDADQHAALSVDPLVFPLPDEKDVSLGKDGAAAMADFLQRTGFGSKVVLETETPAQIVTYVNTAVTVRQQSFGQRKTGVPVIALGDAFDAAKNAQIVVADEAVA